MGSIDKACISGFLCRLCSEMHRTVIHIYGDQGKRLCLVEKINGYLPITISPTDPLPKTICRTCLRRVEQHYSLLMRLTKMREQRKFKHQEKLKKRAVNFDIETPEESIDESTREEVNIQSQEVSSTLNTQSESPSMSSTLSPRDSLSIIVSPTASLSTPTVSPRAILSMPSLSPNVSSMSPPSTTSSSSQPNILTISTAENVADTHSPDEAIASGRIQIFVSQDFRDEIN